MRDKILRITTEMLVVVAIVIIVLGVIYMWLSAPYSYYDNEKGKYVTEHMEKVTYLGNNEYLDKAGNIWVFESNKALIVGDKVNVVMSDNGTDDIEDDIILYINK